MRQDPRALFEVYYDDMVWLVESLQQLNVQAIALGTMPVGRQRCRKRDALGCRKGLNSMIDMVLEHQASAAKESKVESAVPPVFAVDWASVSAGEQGGAHTDHKAGLLGIQRFLSVICPSPAEVQQDMVARGVGDLGSEPCARVGVFSRSCGPDNDWRKMIGRRCNVSTLDMDAYHVNEILNDAESLSTSISADGLQIRPQQVELRVAYVVQDDPLGLRLLGIRQNMLLGLAVGLLLWILVAHHAGALPVPCCEWLHQGASESCWAGLHEGIGQIDDAVRLMCCTSSCLPCCQGRSSRACKMESANELQERGEAPCTNGSKPVDGESRREDAAHADKSAVKGGERRKLDAITGARLLASLHVAATHLARLRPPAAPPIYFFNWGFTWVPWFFMLSGYILAYARLTQPKTEGKAQPKGGSQLSAAAFCHRRLASVYPLYLLGVCISLGILAEKGKLSTVRPSALLSQVFLMQAWLPSETEHALQSQCWFLSAMIPFWLVHQSVVSFVERLPTRALGKLLLLITMLPWILLVFLPGAMQIPHSWYSLHKWKAFKDWIDVLVVVLKFHPASYFHIYVFGVALAAYYLRLRSSAVQLPWILENGAMIAYTLLAMFFSIPALCPPSHKLLCRLGGLVPLQGLLLVGLSEGRDPVAKLLQTKLVAAAGAWSFGIYILHFEVLALWGGSEGGRGVGFGYWLLLLALAAVAHHYVQVPWGTDLRLSLALRLGAAGVFVVAVALSSVPDHLRNTLFLAQHKGSPAAIVYRNGAVDFRLTLRVPPADGELAFIDWMNGGAGHLIINPTLAQVLYASLPSSPPSPPLSPSPSRPLPLSPLSITPSHELSLILYVHLSDRSSPFHVSVQDPSDPTSIWVAARLHRKDIEKHSLHPSLLGFVPPAAAPGLMEGGADEEWREKTRQKERK